MSIFAALNDLLGTLKFIVGILAVLLLFRAFHDRPLRYLAGMLVAHASSGWLLGSGPVQNIAGNLLVISSDLCQICFFRTALHDESRSRPPPRITGEFVVAGAVAVIGVGAWLLAPPSMRNELAQPKNARYLPAFIFVITIVSYHVLVCARVINWTRQLIADWTAGRARSGSDQPIGRPAALRIGIVVIACADLLRLLLDTLRLVDQTWSFIQPAHGSVAQGYYFVIEVALRLSLFLFYVGAMIPVAADATQLIPATITRIRQYRALGPLWQSIVAEFPDVSFRSERRGFHLRFYRREIEIRDGLVLLGPYYDREVADRVGRETIHEPDTSAMIAAALIHDALRAHRSGRREAHPHPLPSSGARNRSDDIDWLVNVARRFAEDTSEPVPSIE